MGNARHDRQLFVPSIGFGLVTASILALASVGFTLQFGVTNILNLAYGDLMTAGVRGYAVNHLAGASPNRSLPGRVRRPGSMLLNRLVYTPFVRRGTKLFGMVMVTLSVGIILQNILLCLWCDVLHLQFNAGAAVHSSEWSSTRPSWHDHRPVGRRHDRRAATAHPGPGWARRCAPPRPIPAWRRPRDRDRPGGRPGLVDLGCAVRLGRVVLVLNTSAFQATTGNDFLVVIMAAAILGGVGRPDRRDARGARARRW